MILSFARYSYYNSSSRKGLNYQPSPVPLEHRRISRNTCQCRVYNHGLRIIRVVADNSNANIRRKHQGLIRCSKGNSNVISQHGQLKKILYTLYEFSRPYTVIGTVTSVISLSLLPLRSLAEISPTFLVGVLKALIPFLLAQLYVTGINQIYDVEIDKLNKPYLPLASGAFSIEFGVGVVSISLLMSITVGMMFGSPPLLFCNLVCCLLGSLYSMEIPFMRWKRNPFLATICVMLGRAIAIPFATFIHIQKYVLGRPILFTKSLIFASCFACLFSIVVALSKDMSDIEGDRLFGFDSLLAVRFGQERVFWICISILMMIYGCAIGSGASSSFLLNKTVTVMGHFVLAAIVLQRALTTDLVIQGSGLAFYMFVWKLFYAEYLLIPFVS